MRFMTSVRIFFIGSFAMFWLTLATVAEADSLGRSVAGSVLVESPTPDAARCAWIQQGPPSQGVIGWVVELAPHEGDGGHDYALYTNGVGAELGIAFFGDLGTCTSTPEELARNRRASAWSVEDGYVQAGRIPVGARFAVLGHWAPGVTGPNYAFPPFQVSPGVAAATQFTFTIPS